LSEPQRGRGTEFSLSLSEEASEEMILRGGGEGGNSIAWGLSGAYVDRRERERWLELLAIEEGLSPQPCIVCVSL